MIALLQFFLSPVGPAAILLVGATLIMAAGRVVRRTVWITGVALFFVMVAAWLYAGLRTEPVVPVYSRPWQPPLQTGTNLLWVGDGWNWYISGLILLLGGAGILLDLNTPRNENNNNHRSESTIAVHMSVLAAGLLFVGSGNILTTMLTWVVLDLFILVRDTIQPQRHVALETVWSSPHHQAKGLSLLGALLLLVGLLPAGPTGPSQPLHGGVLPAETVGLMMLAALIRAGIYPFHLWLLPRQSGRVNISERLLDHMVPVLCGLWLLGWAVEIGAEYILLQPDIITILVLSILGSAVAAWTAGDQANHTTFVLITSAGLAALSGALAFNQGPGGLMWPTTAFALGGAMWLVGDQVWQAWGWQIPVSVGALALAGVPFTPGFLTQPSLARMLVAGPIFLILFGGFVVAQSVQIAALLRSWSDMQRESRPQLQTSVIVRLLAVTVALGLPLAIVGFFPEAIAKLINQSEAIPPGLGNPPSVVAELPVWLTVSLPLAIGIGLVSARPMIWRMLGRSAEQIGVITRLEWLFQVTWWVVRHVTDVWGNVVRVVEGAGYMGWVLVIVLLGFLLIR